MFPLQYRWNILSGKASVKANAEILILYCIYIPTKETVLETHHRFNHSNNKVLHGCKKCKKQVREPNSLNGKFWKICKTCSSNDWKKLLMK